MAPALPRTLVRPRAEPSLATLPVRRWLHRARRSPALWWGCAAVLALAAFGRVVALDDDAEARRRAWGTPVAVAVAAHDLEPGDVVAAGDADVDEWPEAMLPAGALARVPVGRTVTGAVLSGEPLVAARLAPDGLSGTAALVPEGHRAVAVPTSAGGFGTDTPPLALGDRVDVLATFDVLAEEGSPPTEPTGVVAERAVVIDVADTAVTVAVPERDAPRVAFAAARGTVTLALAGAG